MPGSIISGIFGKKAANAQEGAAETAAETQLEMFERSVELSEPWLATGGDALSALSYELGLAELPTFGESTSFNVGDSSFDTRDEAEKFRDSLLAGDGGGGTSQTSTGGVVWNDKEQIWEVDRNAPAPWFESSGTASLGGEPIPGITETTSDGTPYAGFQETPGYQFQLDEGQRAINRSLAARGRLLSGPAVKEGLRFSQGLADQTYSNHLARLANLAGLGANTANQQGAFGIQSGFGIANSQIQAGNARASGYAATGQAISGGINFLGGLAGAISDRRLKTDIRRIGETREGYPTYEFRYIWDAPGTVHIGVMADEVPPEITYEVGAFKAVDYGRVTP